ncbi:MAG TPA: hypothetical protein VF175_08965 [Lacipirellula sp.]
MLHYLAAATIAASTFAVTPSKATWQADYGKALAATRSDQRPLLVVLDNPADPKAAFDAKLLAADGEQGQALKSYRVCRVDVSTEYGQKVAEAFGATQFPHTAIIDRTGSTVLFKQPGQMDGQQWQATLVKYQKGVAPQPQTVYFRGGTVLGAQTAQPMPISNCPSCQRQAMMMGM